MAEELLTQKQLARRWVLSERTLERWRCTGEGPTFGSYSGSSSGSELPRSLISIRTHYATMHEPQQSSPQPTR